MNLEAQAGKSQACSFYNNPLMEIYEVAKELPQGHMQIASFLSD